MKHGLIQNDALWSLVTQFVLIIVMSLVVWETKDPKSAGSFAIGGLVCVLPNIYLYRRVFSFFGARAAKNIVRAFYFGEAVKIVLTAAGFVGALYIPWMKPLWLFVGYIVAQGGFWLAPIALSYWRLKKKLKNQNN